MNLEIVSTKSILSILNIKLKFIKVTTYNLIINWLVMLEPDFIYLFL